MKQFLLKDKPGDDNIVRLTGSDYHYLVRVRRLAAGEFFPALLPDGNETQIQIISAGGGTLTGKCQDNKHCANHQDNICSSSIPPIVLFQALPKSDKMDLITRQAAECGITEIVPFISEFTAVKKNNDEKKLLRWERIIKEARQQSGSKTATVIHSPVTLKELFIYWKKIKEERENPDQAIGILFHHPVADLSSSGEKQTNRILEQESLHGYLNNDISIAALAVGPEGGFSEKEVSLFLENGFKILTIGNTILRTETAALYCSAAIRILLLEKDLWELKKT